MISKINANALGPYRHGNVLPRQAVLRPVLQLFLSFWISHAPCGPSLPPTLRKLRPNVSCSSDEPLLLALVDGLGESRVVDDDRRVGTVCRLRPFGLVGVIGAFVTEHVTDYEDHDAEDSEDHHGDDAWKRNSRQPPNPPPKLPPNSPPNPPNSPNLPPNPPLLLTLPLLPTPPLLPLLLRRDISSHLR